MVNAIGLHDRVHLRDPVTEGEGQGQHCRDCDHHRDVLHAYASSFAGEADMGNDRNMNGILEGADEIMKDTVSSAINPIIMPFFIYGVTNAISVTIWHMQPIALVFERSTLFYVDYNLPTAPSRSPAAFWYPRPLS